jgi:hypothetical protein
MISAQQAMSTKSVSLLFAEVYGLTALQLGIGGTSLIITASENDTQYPDHVTRPGKVAELKP